MVPEVVQTQVLIEKSPVLAGNSDLMQKIDNGVENGKGN